MALGLPGDGVPERVVVSTHGHDPRALEIELTVYGRGYALLYENAWSAADFPECRRSQELDPPAWMASQWVRETLEDLLGDDAVRPVAEAEVDPLAVRWEMQLDERRAERGLPASSPLTPEDDAEATRIAVPDARVREVIASLVGRPALGYLAGDCLRTAAWSRALGRFARVDRYC